MLIRRFPIIVNRLGADRFRARNFSKGVHAAVQKIPLTSSYRFVANLLISSCKKQFSHQYLTEFKSVFLVTGLSLLFFTQESVSSEESDLVSMEDSGLYKKIHQAIIDKKHEHVDMLFKEVIERHPLLQELENDVISMRSEDIESFISAQNSKLDLTKKRLFYGYFLLSKGYYFATMEKDDIKALAFFNTVLALYPNKIDVLNNKAVCLENLESNQEAIAVYDTIIQLRQANPVIYTGKARCLSKLGQYKEAESNCRAALSHDKNFIPAHRDIANVLMHLGKLEEAEDHFKHVLQFIPDSSPEKVSIIHNYGVLFGKKGDDQGALTQYNRALSLIEENFPDLSNPRLMFNKGNVLRRLGEYEESLRWNEQYVQCNPNAEAYETLAQTLIKLNRNEEALASYDQAIALDPDNLDLLSGKANVLAKLKRYEETQKLYETLLSKKPSQEGIMAIIGNDLGVVLTSQEKYEQALRYFDSAIALSPQFADAVANKGTALAGLASLEGLNFHKEAITYFAKAIAINPKQATYYYNLGNSHVMLGDYKEAMQDYEKALKVNPQHVMSYSSKGKVFILLGEKQKARDCFDTMISLFPNVPEGYLNKANLLILTGHMPLSVPYFKTAELLVQGKKRQKKPQGFFSIEEKQSGDEIQRTTQSLHPMHHYIKENPQVLMDRDDITTPSKSL